MTKYLTGKIPEGFEQHPSPGTYRGRITKIEGYPPKYYFKGYMDVKGMPDMAFQIAAVPDLFVEYKDDSGEERNVIYTVKDSYGKDSYARSVTVKIPPPLRLSPEMNKLRSRVKRDLEIIREERDAERRANGGIGWITDDLF